MRIEDAVNFNTERLEGNRLFLYTQKTGVPVNTIHVREQAGVDLEQDLNASGTETSAGGKETARSGAA